MGGENTHALVTPRQRAPPPPPPRTCFRFTTYLASSAPALIILVSRATCSGCSSCIICLSATRSHVLGGPSPVSLSRTPISSDTRFNPVTIFPSSALMGALYGPTP